MEASDRRNQPDAPLTAADILAAHGIPFGPIPGASFGLLVRADADAFSRLSEAEARRVLFEAQLILMRGGRAEEAALRRIARTFGPLGRIGGKVDGGLGDDVLVVSNVMDDEGRPIGAGAREKAIWHADHAYKPCPSVCSVFGAVRIPRGADDFNRTGFLDTRIWARENPERWAAMRGWRLYHDHEAYTRSYYPEWPYREDQKRAYPPVSHPIAVRIPQTGEPAVFLSGSTGEHVATADGVVLKRDRATGTSYRIETGPSGEAAITPLPGDAVVDLMEGLADTRTPSVYWHAYEPDDVVVWSNFGLLHKPPEPRPLVRADDPQARLMLRLTVISRTPGELLGDAR